MRRGARGLTLIELLAIIAAVALLTMLFFPCINTGSEKARTSACLANLKQIGLATAMYLQDYDNTFPWNPAPGGLPASNWGPAFRASDCAPQPSTSFVALLLPYTKTPYLFRCPSSTGYDLRRHLGYAPSLMQLSGAGGSDSAWTDQIGYGFNEVLVASPCRPRTLSSLKNGPGEVALFADAEQPWASSTDRWVKVDGEWERFWDWDPRGRLRHATGQNFVYADGRAGWRQPVAGNDEEEEARDGYYPDAKLE